MGRQKGYTMLTVDMDLNITVRLELAVVDSLPNLPDSLDASMLREKKAMNEHLNNCLDDSSQLLS